MRHTPRSFLTLTALGGALALLARAADAANDGTTVLHAGMAGAREVPGPGSQSASGQATVTVDSGTGEICWDVRVRGIEGDVIAAHIHVGDVAGPVVQPITPPVTGTSSGCATNATLAAALLADPSAYYVNIHSTVFPAGALRGQLAGPHG